MCVCEKEIETHTIKSHHQLSICTSTHTPGLSAQVDFANCTWQLVICYPQHKGHDHTFMSVCLCALANVPFFKVIAPTHGEYKDAHENVQAIWG